MHRHQHTIDGVLGLPALTEPTEGEVDFSYNGDGTIHAATVLRPDLTLRETYVFEYNADGSVKKWTHKSYEADGFTEYRSLVYTVTYNLGPVPPAGTVQKVTVV